MNADDDPVVRREDREPFRAKDGSLVTELVHPSFAPAERQSVAEAVVPAGGETVAHLHREAEEIYTFTAGAGRMSFGPREIEVRAFDSVVIPAGTPHKLRNPGPDPLVLLCVCSPAYSDEDTELLE